MRLQGNDARPGDIGSLITPSMRQMENGCLKMTIYHRGVEPFNLDVYKMSLNNTFIKQKLCSLSYKNVLGNAKHNKYVFKLSVINLCMIYNLLENH